MNEGLNGEMNISLDDDKHNCGYNYDGNDNRKLKVTINNMFNQDG